MLALKGCGYFSVRPSNDLYAYVFSCATGIQRVGITMSNKSASEIP